MKIALRQWVTGHRQRQDAVLTHLWLTKNAAIFQTTF